MTRLFFSPSLEATDSTPSDSQILTVSATPLERYYFLPPEDRIAILSFLCNQAVSSKTVRTHMEACEEALTEYRTTKIDPNRTKKQQ